MAVDTLGNVVTFNPRSARKATPTAVDHGNALTAVACRSMTQCVLVDSAGRVLSGNPHRGGWTVTALRGASALTAVTCRRNGPCVAVDSTGDAFLSRR